jgi:hypothetical protein
LSGTKPIKDYFCVLLLDAEHLSLRRHFCIADACHDPASLREGRRVGLPDYDLRP